MTDRETLAFYDREAPVYADYSKKDAHLGQLDRFMALLSPGARVLDFGCGSGWAGGTMIERGFRASGYDGSEGLASEARNRYGMTVQIGAFSEFSAPPGSYDAVWASFSLLHDTREAMAGNLNRLASAMVQGAPIYIGLKEGKGMERDELGRRYTYFTEPEMRTYLGNAGFHLVETVSDNGVDYAGNPCSYLHIVARKR